MLLTPGLTDADRDSAALSGDERCTRQQDLPPKEAPPFIKVAGPTPTISDTLRLHSLSPAQQFAFALVAERIKQEHDSRLAAAAGQPLQDLPTIERMRMLLLGEPGTGKSRVIRALLWYSFLMGGPDLVRTTSYTWRACQQINTPSHTAVSSCRLFGLGLNQKKASNRTDDVRAALRPPTALIINDESSFTSQAHLAAISACASAARAGTQLAGGQTVTEDDVLGLLHFLLVGDPQQHPPVRARPLYARTPAQTGEEVEEALAAIAKPSTGGSKKAKKKGKGEGEEQHPPPDAASTTGRWIYQQFDTAVMLRQQHRQAQDDPDAVILYNLNRFCRMTTAQQKELATGFAEWLVDHLQARYPGQAEVQRLMTEGALAVVWRNNIKQHRAPHTNAKQKTV